MKKITPFLWFDDQAEQAMKFYVSIFKNSKILEVTPGLWAKLSAGAGEESSCGWVKDRFGLWWQIIPEAFPRLMGDTDPVRAKRVVDAMLKMKKIEVAELERAYAW